MTYHYMPLPKIYEHLNCPWCKSHCMIIEYENWGVFNKEDPLSDNWKFRVYARCDECEAAESDDRLNDAMGNDYGRGAWEDTVEDAIDDWMFRAIRGLATNQKGVW